FLPVSIQYATARASAYSHVCSCSAYHLTLHSFPTRRSSDLNRVDEVLRIRSERGSHAAQVTIVTAACVVACKYALLQRRRGDGRDRKSTRLNSSHVKISYAVFCLKKKNNLNYNDDMRLNYSS